MPRGTKRGIIAQTAPTDEDLESLVAAAPPPDPPVNLGNLPGPQPPTRAVESGTGASEPADAEPAEPAEPVETLDATTVAAAPEPAGDPEDEGDDDSTAWQQRVADLERENQFLRMQHAPQAPAAPPPTGPQSPQEALALIDQFLGGFTVTPEDVQVLLTDPVRGAAYLRNGVRAAVAAGAAMAIQQARSEFAQHQAGQSQATQLRDAFYGQHPELEPYAKVVLSHARDVREQYGPTLPAQHLIDETARRTTAELSSWGVDLRGTRRGAAPRAAGGRRRPAFAEGGGGGRVNGATRFNAQEREMYDLLRQ